MSNLRWFLALVMASACASSQPRPLPLDGRRTAAADTAPPRLPPGVAIGPTWPAEYRHAGIEGHFVVLLSVDAKGRVDTGATQVAKWSNARFAKQMAPSFSLSLATWRLRPAVSHGKRVPGTLSVALDFVSPAHCLWSQIQVGHDLTNVYPDSTPPKIVVTSCEGGASHYVFDPKYITTRHAIITGLWNIDNMPTSLRVVEPCRDSLLPIPTPGLTQRFWIWLSIDPAMADSNMIRDWSLLSAPRRIAGQDGSGLMVRMEGELTGPQPSGPYNTSPFAFRPTRILGAQPWSEEHRCRI